MPFTSFLLKSSPCSLSSFPRKDIKPKSSTTEDALSNVCGLGTALFLHWWLGVGGNSHPILALYGSPGGIIKRWKLTTTKSLFLSHRQTFLQGQDSNSTIGAKDWRTNSIPSLLSCFHGQKGSLFLFNVIKIPMDIFSILCVWFLKAQVMRRIKRKYIDRLYLQ